MDSSTKMEITETPVSTIREVGKHEGQSVILRGWLYNMRESGKLVFPIFRDGTGTIQGVAHKAGVAPEVFDALKSLTQESSVIVTGKVRADKRAPGGYELDVEQIEIVQRVPEDDPLSDLAQGAWRRVSYGTPAFVGTVGTAGRHPPDSRRDYAGCPEYFDSNGFTRTDPPILTPAACEGTSTLFPVDYFGDEAFLTQSGQLYIESTALALGKVYSFGPTFRAENPRPAAI